jgi:hypothetical protein
MVDRARLRRAAQRYAGHGWPVTPGAVLVGDRHRCDRPGCHTTGPHPAVDGWESAATTDPGRIGRWWQEDAYGVLLRTGVTFDVLDVPARLGLDVLGLQRMRAGTRAGTAAHGPVAVTPTGRWMFLVRVGDPLCPELDSCLDIVRHSEGSWVPAPPTRTAEGRVSWTVSPSASPPDLPASYAVQEMLVHYVGRPGRGRAGGVDRWAA